MSETETRPEMEADAPPPTHLQALDYVFVVMKRWPYLLLGLVAGLAAVALVWGLSEPVYESSCGLLVERYATPATFGAPVLVLRGDWLATEVQLVTSEMVLGKACESLDGAVTPQMLAARLLVENPNGTQLLKIRYRASDPGAARTALEAVIGAYKSHFQDRTQGFEDRVLEWYREQEPRLRAEMVKAENERFELQRELGFSSLEGPQEAASEGIRSVSGEITELRIRRATAAARLEALRSLGEGSSPEVLLHAFPEAGPLAKLAEHHLTLSEDLAAKEETLGPNNPLVAALRARLEATQRKMQDAARMAGESLKAEIATIDHTIKGMEALLDETRRNASQVVHKSTELDKLRRQEERRRQIYEPCLKGLSELTLTRSFKSGYVEVVDRPKVPSVPVWPSASKLAVIGLFLGTALGSVFAFLRESLDDSAKMAEDVLRIWHMPVLGFVPHLEDGASLEALTKKARLGKGDIEPLRMLAVSLDRVLSMQRGEGEPGEVVVFTSPGPKEGKTLLALSTGLMLAQNKKRILLVDADFRRRGLTAAVELRSAPGIRDWIQNRDEVAAYVANIPDETLDVLPAGQQHSGQVPAFGPEMVRDLLEELRSKYDYIIVDVPPVSLVSDTLTLAHTSARVVMVARMGTTSKRLFRRSRHLAETTGIRVTGVVINDYNAPGVYSGYYYRYYGYYHYREYADREAGSRKDGDVEDET